MNDPSPTQMFFDDSATVPVPRSIQRAYLWLLGVVGIAAAALVLTFAVATQSNADSERIARSDGNGVKAILSAIVATHGRPGAL